MSTELVCLFDRDFVLVHANDAWCKFFGVSRELTLGRSFMDFVPWSDGPATKSDILVLSPGCQEASYKHPAGFGIYTIGWVQWTYRAVLDELDRIAAFEAVGQPAPEWTWADRLQRSASATVH